MNFLRGSSWIGTLLTWGVIAAVVYYIYMYATNTGNQQYPFNFIAPAIDIKLNLSSTCSQSPYGATYHLGSLVVRVRPKTLGMEPAASLLDTWQAGGQDGGTCNGLASYPRGTGVR